ncbi:mitochondrial import inner membrane translocase subunit Tim9-like [Watersipora subatra]|uniref:mitochondrial import inner membrane translocase subunit Tim9-like n=1 Tax=Watersipora subatra TaxID=2589382 RepID=UPI00355C4C73
MAMPNPAAGAAPEDMVKQFREFLLTYNKVSEMCFDACIHDFKTRKINDKETGCTNFCMDKYLKMTQRISQRFAEHQVNQNEAQLGPLAAKQNT